MKNILLTAIICAGLWAAPAMAATYEGGVTPYKAPALTGLTNWMNSEPLTLDQLKGRVVLIDFWTYSCINCVRTLPMLAAWDKKYRDKGLTIIGVSTPEFAFEKDPANVTKAVKRFGIPYPVALDNDLATWRAFNNNYWPAEYLIDRSGNVVATHFGEGNYAESESNIRTALGLSSGSLEEEPDAPYAKGQSPETYLGSARAQNFRSVGGLQTGKVVTYSFPFQLGESQWALSGDWEVRAERTIAQAPGAGLRYRFVAGKVFLVMGPLEKGKPVTVSVQLDGKPIMPAQAGKNVTNGIVTVDNEMLYELVDLRGDSGRHTLDLTAQQSGLAVYAFTFGK